MLKNKQIEPLHMDMDRNKSWHSPVFFHCQGPPTSCKDLAHCSHDSHPPLTDHTDKHKHSQRSTKLNVDISAAKRAESTCQSRLAFLPDITAKYLLTCVSVISRQG